MFHIYNIFKVVQIQQQTYYQDFHQMIKRLHNSPPINSKLCQKSMTPMNYPKLFFLLIKNWPTNINGKTLAQRLNMKWVHTQNKYFRVGSNISFIHIMCEGKTVIPSILQSYIFHWYHRYLLHPRIDRTETIICQHLC